jgi:hypothetical protein
VVAATPSLASCCGVDFKTFVASISSEAAAAGISQGVIGSAFAGRRQRRCGVPTLDRRPG